LCDLAGSEKIGKEEKLDEAHMKELKTINMSLSALGKVIQALSKGAKKKHIPYRYDNVLILRESKITRLL
jgi:hypothetical protein